MCLEYKEDFNVKLNEKGEGIGYKAFYEESGDYWSPIYGRGKIPLNKWVKSNKGKLLFQCEYPDKKYLNGFHFMARKKDAKAFMDHYYSPNIIKRIKFRKVVATGTQIGIHCIVAREIMILSK